MAILDDDVLALDPPALPQPLAECVDVVHVNLGRATGEIPYAADASCRLRLNRERRKKADYENDREPDQPHGTSIGDWLAGSLAERRDAHQRGAAHEKPSVRISHDPHADLSPRRTCTSSRRGRPRRRRPVRRSTRAPDRRPRAR
jgi:hypothetical protein